jgi:CRP/FNR family transcriptional regulator, cyclic AMP receptor protein
LTKTKLVAALFTGSARQVSRNTKIFRAGEPTRSLLLVASGLVKLTDISTSGDEIILALYRSGEIFGELCFRGGVQECDATAIERSEIIEIPADLLIEHIRTRPDALMELLGELSGRLAAAHGELQALFSQTVLVRLGTKLLDLAAESKTGGDWLDLPHDFRHEELAQMLSVRRETVTRAMANLKELGLVATAGRGRVRVHRSEMRRFVRGKQRFT